MLRRDIRLRKEYLIRKSQEGKQKEEYDKKQKIREALASNYLWWKVWFVGGKRVPTELRNEAEKLKHTVDMEDDKTKELKVDCVFYYSKEIDTCRWWICYSWYWRS